LKPTWSFSLNMESTFDENTGDTDEPEEDSCEETQRDLVGMVSET
jgi:hypothetical protein